MRPLIFCVEASAEIGMGHLMRCIALAQAAEDQGIPSWFVLPEAIHKICRQRHEWPYGLVAAAADEKQLAHDVVTLAQARDAAAIVVDGYGFSGRFANALQAAPGALIVLDDIHHDAVDSADIIVNPAGINAQHHYQQRNPAARLCLGPEYRLLRREFAVTIPLPPQHRHSLTLNMGGSDPNNLTIPVLNALALQLPDAQIRVVTGAGYSQADALQETINRLSTPVQHVHNSQDMADVWRNARLAVAAAGGSQFELVACHTPSVLLTVADNQRTAAQQASQQQWCEVQDATTGLDIEHLAARVAQLWRDETKLQLMHEAAKRFAIVDGAERILVALAGYLAEA